MEKMETEITETSRKQTQKRIRKYGDALLQCVKEQKEGGKK